MHRTVAIFKGNPDRHILTFNTVNAILDVLRRSVIELRGHVGKVILAINNIFDLLRNLCHRTLADFGIDHRRLTFYAFLDELRPFLSLFLDVIILALHSFLNELTNVDSGFFCCALCCFCTKGILQGRKEIKLFACREGVPISDSQNFACLNVGESVLDSSNATCTISSSDRFHEVVLPHVLNLVPINDFDKFCSRNTDLRKLFDCGFINVDTFNELLLDVFRQELPTTDFNQIHYFKLFLVELVPLKDFMDYRLHVFGSKSCF